MNTLRHLPSSLYGTYQVFTLYFKGILFKVNRMQGKHIFTVMFILAFVLVLLKLIHIWRKNKLKAVLYGGLVLLYPVAAHSVILIATEAAFEPQMACGIALFLAALPCLLYDQTAECFREKTDEDKNSGSWRSKVRDITKKCEGVLNQIFIFFMAVILYGSIVQVVIDQNIMYEGRVATESIVDMVMDKLLQEDLVSSEYRYVFIGTPVGSNLYAINANVEHANMYALYGAWYLGGTSASSWRGVLRNEKGINLDMITGSEYESLTYSELVENMSLFPEEGSILLNDNIVYVKISAAY